MKRLRIVGSLVAGLSAGLVPGVAASPVEAEPVAVITEPASCPPEGFSREDLLALRAGGFVLADEGARNALAIGLLACVGDPDPALRDAVVFEAWSAWLRHGLLTDETRLVLFDSLLLQLADPLDPTGFRRPFAALDLAEVARTDRIEPWLTEAMRRRLIDAAAGYLGGVRDYRGYSEVDGWRHGVAHGADLALQLTLNPAVDGAGLRALLDALGAQVAPAANVYYVHGEPERLVRVVSFAYRRAELDESYWAAWFDRVASPGSFGTWPEALRSEAGLARRHNTIAFLSLLHFAASAAPEPDLALATLAESALRRVLGE